jgi:hypothetical protein
VAVCYLKNEVSNRRPAGADQQPSVTGVGANDSSGRVSQSESVEVKRLAKPVKLVYSCASDHTNYHTSVHLPANCDRSALSEDAAFQRGLKPCSICMPD